MSILDEWLKNAQYALLGPRCLLCRAPAALDRELCEACLHELPWLEHACRYCALTLTSADTANVCRSCARKPLFDAAVGTFSYHDPVRWFVTRLKFGGQLAHARLLGDLLGARVLASDLPRPDLLVPVPLHKAGYRRRGFNQAMAIAQRVSRQIDCRIAPEAVTRIRDTGRQSTLPADQRAANVRNAFICTQAIDARHVAIVDDVVTTGQTAAAVAACLKQAGVERVDIYCVARA